MGLAGLGGLAQGFAQGLRLQSDLNERELQNQRQAKLDAQREEQLGWERNRAQDEQQKRENQQALDKAIVDNASAGKVDNNGAAVTYTNDAGEQKTAYQPDLQTAQFAAQQQALEEGSAPTAPAVQTNPAAETASSVRTLDGGRKLFTGLTAAQEAKKYADENNPGTYAKYMALSEKLAGMAGGQEMADKYLQRAKVAEKEGAFRALSLLDAGDTAGAMKAWNGTGASRLEPGQAFKTVTDKSGNRIHQVVNEDGSVVVPNIESALINHISGIEGVQTRAQAAAKLKNDMALKQWEFENDPTKRYRDVKPGSDIYDTKTGTTVTDNKTGYVPALDSNGNPTYDEDGSMRMVKAGTKGMGANTGSGKVPEGIKLGLDGQKDLIPTAVSAYETLRGHHPGLKDAEAQAIASRFAKTGNTDTKFDPKTGLFNDFFVDKREVDKDGKQIGDATGGTYLVRSREYADGGPISKQQAAKAFTDWKSGLSREELAYYTNTVKSPESVKAFSDNARQKVADLKKTAEEQYAAATTPQEKARINALWQEQSQKLEAEARKVDFFRQQYKPETTNGPGAGKLDAPRGLYQPKAGVPAELAARTQAADKAAADKVAADKAAADAKKAATDQRKAEISWLTEAEASVMKPKEASTYLGKYQDVLDPSVARALRRRM